MPSTTLSAHTPRNYDSIDLMKLVLSVMVLMIHAKPFSDVSPTAEFMIDQGITRLAVPLFFIASAYFYFKKLGCTTDYNIKKQYAKKYVSRIFRLYCAWFIISLPIIAVDRFILPPYSFEVNLFRFVRGFFFSSTFGGSWYLMSSIFCCLLFCWIEQFNSKARVVIITVVSIVAYLMCVLSSSYRGFFECDAFNTFYSNYEMLFCNPYTSVLVGIPYFGVTRLLQMEGGKFKNNKYFKYGFSTITIAMLICEIYIVNASTILRSHDCYFMLLPCAALLFPIIVNSKIACIEAKQYRALSTIIFFSQFVWLFLFLFLDKILHIAFHSMLMFVLVLSLTIITYYVIVKASKRFPLLKNLY